MGQTLVGFLAVPTVPRLGSLLSAGRANACPGTWGWEHAPGRESGERGMRQHFESWSLQTDKRQLLTREVPGQGSEETDCWRQRASELSLPLSCPH